MFTIRFCATNILMVLLVLVTLACIGKDGGDESTQTRPLPIQGATLYATSTDDSTVFLAYHPSTDSWSQRASINTYSQLAVDNKGNVHAYDRGSNQIRRYDPLTNVWKAVAKGPGLHQEKANLEILNDGRMILTHNGGRVAYVYENREWTSRQLGFVTNQIGDYDPTTGQFVLGEQYRQNVYLINTGDFSKTLYDLGTAASVGERRRGGSILNNVFYQMSDSDRTLLGFALVLPPGPIQTFGLGQSLGFAATAVNRHSGLLYILDLGGNRRSLDVYDPATNTFRALSSAPSSLGNNSTAIFGGVIATELTRLD